MPTYDYQCASCRHVFELMQPITAKPLKKVVCPQCGKERPVQRLMGTGGALIFKGSGFYLTDYRSESYKKGAEAETKAATPAAEAKPAAADSAKPASEPAAASTKASEPAKSTATSKRQAAPGPKSKSRK